MENANVLRLRCLKMFKDEDQQHYGKWYRASFMPMFMSSGKYLGIESCRPIKGSPEQFSAMTAYYLENIEKYLDHQRSPDLAAYLKDIETTWGGKYDIPLSAVYLLAKRIEGKPTDNLFKEGSDNPPAIHVEGIDLPEDLRDKYHLWMYEWGYPFYIPLLLKLPGVNEYTRWWFYSICRDGLPPVADPKEEAKYPGDLTIFYFDDLKSLKDFENSKELLFYRKALNDVFPGISGYKWYVNYQVSASWRK